MKLLVVSVHPDDETLGCGGTLLKHAQQGDEIFWLILTKLDQVVGFSQDSIERREREIKMVARQYGFKEVVQFDFITTQLHLVDFALLVGEISRIIKDLQPELVYMNNRSDIHTDHQIAAKAILSSTKSFRAPFVRKILMYECLSETEFAPPFPENLFSPNVFSDITDFIDKKLEIMRIYQSEVQNPPQPRSMENIRALARFRGASCGVDYAEAFMLIREKF